MTTIDTRYVQFFDAGIAPDHDQLGGKCASLVTMTAAGMPVPPGFAVTTGTYDAFIAESGLADFIAEHAKPELDAGMHKLECLGVIEDNLNSPSAGPLARATSWAPSRQRCVNGAGWPRAWASGPFTARCC